MTQENQLDFSMLLASSVHDIKNSVGMLLASLDEMIDIDAEERPEQLKKYSILRGEASRINQTLIYLLGLYHLQLDQLSLNLNEVYVKDFLEEQVASQQLLFDVNQINVVIECDDVLTGYFDEHLIAGVINNILINGAKYTKDTLMLTAVKVDRGIEINIIDNGNGYPSAIIESTNESAADAQHTIDFSSGSTHLGLYFAQKIAEFHSFKGNAGSIKLCNLDSGGCFTLLLP